MTCAIARLAFAGIRGGRVQALLTLVVVSITAATLALALEVRQTATDPWQRTFDATNGAHVWAVADAYGADLSGFLRLPGVRESTSIEYVNTSFVRHGIRYGLALAAAKESRPRVDKPLLVAGSAVRNDSLVLERSMARSLDLAVGDDLRVASSAGTRLLRVVGIAITSGRPGYPRQQPGLGWTTRATLARVQPHAARRLTAIGLRLANPAALDAFLLRARPAFTGGMHVVDYRSIRDATAHDTRDNQKVLSTQAVFLLLAAGLILATLVAARVLAQSREIGLLKAIGLTPGQVVAVYAAQYLALGLGGTVAGLAIARVLAPSFLRTSGEVLAATSPPFSVGISAVVLVAVEAIVTVFASIPAWRAARRTTSAALTAGRAPARSSHSGAAQVAEAMHLPPTAVVGLKDAFSRPGRALLTALSLALTVAVVVAVLELEQSWRNREQADRAVPAQTAFAPPPLPTVGPAFSGDPNYDSVAADRARLRPLVYASIGILGAVGLVNLLVTAILSVRERRRELAILRTIGMTPSQVRASVLWSHAVVGLAAAVIGIPLGVLTYRVVGDTTVAPWWALGAVAPLTILMCILSTVVPANRAATGYSVSDALRLD